MGEATNSMVSERTVGGGRGGMEGGDGAGGRAAGARQRGEEKSRSRRRWLLSPSRGIPASQPTPPSS